MRSVAVSPVPDLDRRPPRNSAARERANLGERVIGIAHGPGAVGDVGVAVHHGICNGGFTALDGFGDPLDEYPLGEVSILVVPGGDSLSSFFPAVFSYRDDQGLIRTPEHGRGAVLRPVVIVLGRGKGAPGEQKEHQSENFQLFMAFLGR